MAAGGTALFRQLHRHPFPFVAGTLQQRNHRRPNQENGLPFRHVQSEPIQGSHGQTVADKRGYSADYGLRGTDADQVPQTVPATGKDLFLFSYLSCGINLTDILHIRYADIVDGRLVFNRQKTGKLLSFQLQPAALDILDKYRQPNAHPQDYVFPVLRRSVHITAQQQYGRVQRTNKRINRYLKLIGEHLHLPITLTTYVARHSFATVLKRSGVSTSIISESLGHSSEKITQIYLDSFENSQIDAAMQNLL